MQSKAKTPDDYIAELPADRKEALIKQKEYGLKKKIIFFKLALQPIFKKDWNGLCYRIGLFLKYHRDYL